MTPSKHNGSSDYFASMYQDDTPQILCENIMFQETNLDILQCKMTETRFIILITFYEAIKTLL